MEPKCHFSSLMFHIRKDCARQYSSPEPYIRSTVLYLKLPKHHRLLVLLSNLTPLYYNNNKVIDTVNGQLQSPFTLVLWYEFHDLINSFIWFWICPTWMERLFWIKYVAWVAILKYKISNRTVQERKTADFTRNFIRPICMECWLICLSIVFLASSVLLIGEKTIGK